jgi:hypothetical protein
MPTFIRIFYFTLTLTGVSQVLNGQCTNYPIVDLGPDTILCANAYLLDAGNPGMSYSWNSGDTSQFFNAQNSGIFTVTVTDSIGCASTDSVSVTLHAPSVSGAISISGGDSALCGNEYVWFYSSGHSGIVLWWVMDTMNWVWMPFHSGDTVDFGITPNGINGYYQFLITTVNGNCPPDTADIFTVEMHSSPVVSLPNDGLACFSGFSLDAGYPGLQHMWNDGSTSQYHQIDSSGTYFVTVTDTTGCFGTDTVTYFIPPQITVALGSLPDTVCSSDGALLLSASPGGGVFSGQGVAGNVFDPSIAGQGLWSITYEITDSSGCVFADEVFITVENCVGIFSATNSALNIFPNPASDYILLEGLSKTSSVEILNMNGEVVSARNKVAATQQMQIDLDGLADGVYILRVNTSDKYSYHRFVKAAE